MVKKSPEREEKDNNTAGGNSVKYTGVRKRKWGKWVSEIRLPNSRERIWLGSYDSPEKAARAFDAAQFCLRGKSANFNFPDNPPEIDGGRSMTPLEIQAAAARFANFSASDCRGDDRRPEDLVVEESAEAAASYSPSFSDGATVQMDGVEVTKVEASFQEQLSLSSAIGSGNYVADLGFLTEFDDFTGGEFLPIPQTDNFDYYYGHYDDTYDASLYQDSCLWNF